MIKVLKWLLYISLILLIVIPILIWYFWRKDYYGSLYLKRVSELDECTPYDFFIDVKSPTMVDLSWKTKADCPAYVKLDKGDFITANAQIIYSVDGNLPKKDHHFSIGGLDPTIIYSLVIVTNSYEYGIDGDVIHLRLSK